MSLDFNKTFKDMISAVQNALTDNLKDAKDIGERFLNSKKDRIERFTRQRINGEISDAELKFLLKNEMRLLEMEKNAGVAIGKATAQKAINSAIEVLQTAVKTALGSVI